MYHRKARFLVLAVILLLIASLGGQKVSAEIDDGENWFHRDWDYRMPVSISNPCGTATGGYQVQISLDGTNFNFSNARSDAADLRVTTSDGITPVPFWIEGWDATGEQASLWTKIPTIPLAGTTIYLYYGNPSPASNLVESPPIGPWTRAVGNPILPIGGPVDGKSLLAENVVYDAASGHYWMVHANYTDSGVGLVWSDTPTDPTSWNWHGTVMSSANAPHLIADGGYWYIFYADRGHGGPPYPISVARADTIEGPYTHLQIILTSTETWETYRVDEPYVFQRNDSKWILMYMGDQGSTTELIGYATADDISGPYTKYAGNPVLEFGPAGSFDAGTIADPWVVEFYGTYYIGYTVSPTIHSPWQTAYATTTDWINFTKHGIILPLGPGGAWDANNAFRGAVTRIGDTYVFPYTGDSYQMGIATQEVYLPVNQQEQVFPFFDEFNDGIVDASVKWVLDNGTSGQLSESGGSLTLTANSTYYIKIHGQTSFGMDYLVEARARHPQAGTSGLIPELGLAGSSLANTVRMANDFHQTTHWERQAKTSTDDDNWVDMAQTVDTDWHTFRIYRLSPETAGFQIDGNPPELYVYDPFFDTHVPTGSLPAFLMSYGNGNQLIVDWIRVRKYCGADATATPGAEEPRPLLGSISIEKSGDAQVLSGGTVNFNIIVTNNGDFDLTDVTVRDALAPDCDRDFTLLAIGASQSYGCSLSGVSEDFTNTVLAEGSLATGGTVTDSDSTFVDVLHPSITIEKAPEAQDVVEGFEAVFTITVTNSGDATLENVTVTDPLVPSCDQVIGTLNAGQSSIYNCSSGEVTISFVNTASVTSHGPFGSSPNDTDDAAVNYINLDDVPWIDPDWGYRSAVTVSCPCTQPAVDYQVLVELNSSNFDFGLALADGSDVVVTNLDGVTQIPFWIESWDAVGEQASVWVKVPSIPLSGTAIFLYYGNPSPPGPPVTENPPIGPWTKAIDNPILPIGGPATGQSLLAENIVYDDTSGHYWMVHANYNDHGVGLVWSDTPTDPTSWNWYGTVISSANAPHILQHGGTWYIFFSDWSTPSTTTPHSIQVIKSTSITGPYTNRTTILSPDAATWENWRVDEPYVFQRNDGKWILVYMGDQANYPTGPFYYEQVGYAIADDLLGPYTKYAGNPFLAWGPPGSFDAGTIADPWVVEFNGTYYIGYTVSPTTSHPWQTAYATTTDWINFTKHGITLPLGPSGAWDANNAFRGAVTRIGDTYVFAYTGDSYQMGTATQPVYMQEPFNEPGVVFPFFDDFNDDVFDNTIWSIDSGSASQLVESGGTLTLNSLGTGVGDFIKVYGLYNFGMDHLIEFYARHPQAGTDQLIAEFGLMGAGFGGDKVRIADDFYNTTYWERQAALNSTPEDPWELMNQVVDTNWHLFSINRVSPNEAGFQVDNNPVETTSTHVPTSDLPAFLMSYGNGSQLIVDWVRVRSWCGAEAVTQVRESQIPTAVRATGFEADSDGKRVHLKWQTSQDLDTIGYNLYRATSLNGPREKLNSHMILSASFGSLTGESYQFVDKSTRLGQVYYYWLEIVKLKGSEILDPISIRSGLLIFMPIIKP